MSRILSLFAFLLLASSATAEPIRPNILWLVCEDASVHWFGCYGGKNAKTPNIDALAKQGFRYTHAYSCAPVCAPSRSTWITGMYAVSNGTQPMRSRYAIPHSQIPYYPDQLRKAGYYTANFAKTDYNIGGRADTSPWDSSKANDWVSRKPGQPFFQIMNFNSSHESSAHGDVTKTKHSPDDVTLFQYHPDELGIRQTYAKYHDAISTMDTQVGKVLADLEKAGLAEDTIVIFNSDHGGVMPRSKRFLYNSGTHCPLIVRIPEKFKHLYPVDNPGTTVDRLVSFIDMPKTWLSLVGAEIPATMQGRIFLGPKAEAEPQYAFSFRERMDERMDSSRAIRDKKYLYIRNSMPFVPHGQHLNYLWLMQATKSWEAAHRAKRTNEVTGRFFEPKAIDELYDVEADPDNVVNLAGNPEHQERLKTMKAKLREWQLSIFDSGLLPEFERDRRATENKLTIYEMVRNPKLYDLPKYLDAADMALANDVKNATKLREMLKDTDSGVRYWAVVGLFLLENTDADSLKSVLNDPCGEIGVLVAWKLMKLGEKDAAQQAFLAQLKKHGPSTLMTLNALDWANVDLAPYAEAIRAIPKPTGKGENMGAYEQRMVEYFNSSKKLGK
jgi:N-sulfoglucosamine sulfohydrolase